MSTRAYIVHFKGKYLIWFTNLKIVRFFIFIFLFTNPTPPSPLFFRICLGISKQYWIVKRGNETLRMFDTWSFYFIFIPQKIFNKSSEWCFNTGDCIYTNSGFMHGQVLNAHIIHVVLKLTLDSTKSQTLKLSKMENNKA